MAEGLQLCPGPEPAPAIPQKRLVLCGFRPKNPKEVLVVVVLSLKQF